MSFFSTLVRASLSVRGRVAGPDRGEALVCGLEHRTLGHDDRPLDPVLQLADVCLATQGPDGFPASSVIPVTRDFQRFPVPQDEAWARSPHLSPFRNGGTEISMTPSR